MDREQIKKLLPLYIEGELQGEEHQQVKSALANDPELQKHADELKKTWALLDETQDIQPDSHYLSKFWTRASLQKSWSQDLFERFSEASLRRRLIPAFATALIVVVACVFSVQHYLSVNQTQMIVSSISKEDMAMIQDLELVENLDVIEDIEFLEDLEILEELEEFNISYAV